MEKDPNCIRSSSGIGGCRKRVVTVALCIEEAGFGLDGFQLSRRESGSEAAKDMAVGVQQPRFAGIEGGVWEEGPVKALKVTVAEEIVPVRPLHVDDIYMCVLASKYLIDYGEKLRISSCKK